MTPKKGLTIALGVVGALVILNVVAALAGFGPGSERMPAPEPVVQSPPPVPAPVTDQEMVDYAERILRLYDELQAFKDDPEFRRVGFGVCCQFNEWKRRVEAFRDDAGTSAWGAIAQDVEHAFSVPLPGDLLLLGLAYNASNRGGQPPATERVVPYVKLRLWLDNR